jgi:subtilisin-like proprotein convertase family protein
VRPLLAALLACALAPAAAGAAELSGTLFDDRNGDGAARAGEPGVANWVVYVDADGDSELDGGATCTASTSEPCALTDGGGRFRFTGLSTGPLQVRLVPQPGWGSTTPPVADVLLLSEDAVVDDVAFGVFRLGVAGGAVFADVDGDGRRDPGDAGLAGWTVFDDADLDAALDAGEASAGSDVGGAYALFGLALGAHALRLPTRCGFRLTLPPPPGRHVLSISTSGQVIGDRDFGLQPPAVLPGDGNGDGTVGAADLVAVAAALGTAPAYGRDADQDGAVTAADVAATAGNAFACTGLQAVAPAPAASATATASATASLPAATPTATASASPTASPARVASPSATATAIASSTASPTATAVPATASASPTASGTPTRTATAGAPAIPVDALAGTAAHLANGTAAIPAVVTALASGLQFGSPLVFDPTADRDDGGGPAGACPFGGTATRGCGSSGGQATLGIDFDDCRVATASGTVALDALPPAAPAVALRGSLCVGGVALPPWSATIGVSAVFRDPQDAALLTATAQLTGSINPTPGGSCYATGATLHLSGPIRTRFADGSSTTLTFTNTAVVVAVARFNAQCVPIDYTMTFNGPATMTVVGPPALVAAAPAETATGVTFTDFVVSQDASGSPTLTALDGGLGAACADTGLTLDTVAPLAQAVGAPCPHDGILRISAGGASARLLYRAGGAVGVDADGDGSAESQLDSCREAPPLCSDGAATPTATTAPAATPSRSATPAASPTASATATRTLSPPGPTATIPASATASATAAVTVTPSATPPPEPDQYCDTLSGPALIPDDSPTGINNDIVVSSARSIADLDVAVSIAHTWVGDLRVVLTHVGTGTTVVLLDQPGVPTSANGCARDDVDAVFDDAALRPAEDRCAVGAPLATIDGSVHPSGSLAAFAGESLAGTWRLAVSDRNAQDVGSLLGWCLRPNSRAPVATDFVCAGDASECLLPVDVPFNLGLSWSDPDGDAVSWHITARREDGFEFAAGSGTLPSGSGGEMVIAFDPFTCPTLDCPDTAFDYFVRVRDAAGHDSPAQRLRLIVTLFIL